MERYYTVVVVRGGDCTVSDTVRSSIARLRSVPWAYPLAVFLVALLSRLAYLARILQGSYGVRTPPDTGTFRRSCDVLWTDPTAIFAQTKGLQYLGFTIPFCAVDRFAGGLAWVLVQIVLSAVTAVLVYYTATRLVDRTAGLVAGLSFAVLFDTLRFTVFLLSETTFTFALVLAAYALVRYRSNPTKRARALVFGSLGLVAVTRPFGAPIVAGWFLLETLPRDNDYRTGFFPRWGAIAVAVVLPVVMLLFSSAPEKAATMERGWREGWIMYLGKSNFVLTEYAYTPRPSGSFLEFVAFNVDHIAVMGILRVAIFFVPLIGGAGFSPFWTGLNVVVLGPLVLGTLYGTVRAVRFDPEVFSVLAVPVLVVVAIVAVTFISLSWRYRAPLGPFFAMMTGYAVATYPLGRRAVERVRSA